MDPVTGVVIDRVEDQHQEFRYNGKSLTALETTSKFTKDTVDKNVEDYKSKSSLLSMVKSTFPMAFGILGALLLLTGLILSILIGRRRDLDEQPAYVDNRPDPVFGPSDPDQPTLRRSDIHGG